MGSSGVVKYEFNDAKPELLKEPKVEFVDDGPGKPVGIYRFIDRRPVFRRGQGRALHGAGSSHRRGARICLRSPEPHRPARDEAVRRKWIVVDMKED